MSKNKNDELTVVFCTRETDHENKEEFMNMLQNTAGCEITISMISNPDGISLSQIYKDVLHIYSFQLQYHFVHYLFRHMLL